MSTLEFNPIYEKSTENASRTRRVKTIVYYGTDRRIFSEHTVWKRGGDDDAYHVAYVVCPVIFSVACGVYVGPSPAWGAHDDANICLAMKIHEDFCVECFKEGDA